MVQIRKGWLAGGLSVLVAAVALLMWVTGNDATASLAEVKQALSGETAAVDVRMTVDSPDRPGETDTFTGSGIIFGDGRASFTYDFSSLPNAGGFFGHLTEFDMKVSDERLYLGVLPGKRWLLVEDDDLEEFARSDIERLREVVLGSPYLIQSFLRGDVLTAGSETVTVAISPAELIEEASGFSTSTIRFLDLIEADPIRIVFAVDSESVPTSARYEISFPIARGATDNVVVTVTVDFREIGVASTFEEPDESEATTFEELKREGVV